MQACINWNPIRRKRIVMLQSKLLFFCSRFLYVTPPPRPPPLKRVAFFSARTFGFAVMIQLSINSPIAFEFLERCSSINSSFIWIIMCSLLALGFSWIPKKGSSERVNFHNWKSEKIPVLYQLCSLRIRKTQLLVTTHKCPKMHEDLRRCSEDDRSLLDCTKTVTDYHRIELNGEKANLAI